MPLLLWLLVWLRSYLGVFLNFKHTEFKQYLPSLQYAFMFTRSTLNVLVSGLMAPARGGPCVPALRPTGSTAVCGRCGRAPRAQRSRACRWEMSSVDVHGVELGSRVYTFPVLSGGFLWHIPRCEGGVSIHQYVVGCLCPCMSVCCCFVENVDFGSCACEAGVVVMS